MSASSPAVVAPAVGLPPIQDYTPTTFLDRGVAVPFTTPQLAAARARPGGRGGLELIVPNPSGGRGVYILAWDSVGALCRPTVHDSRLSTMVSGLRGVTPGAIRQAARDVAAEGFAGREAAAAAREARRAQEQLILRTNFDLVLELVRQVERPDENQIPPEQDRPARQQERAQRAMARIAPLLGRTAESVAASLEQLAALYGGIGVGRPARLPGLVADIGQLRQELTAYAAVHPDGNIRDAEMIACVADLTIVCARATLADAQALAGDVIGMLRRWAADPDALAALLARPEWLLDGWDRVCALWQTADTYLGQEQTLTEMAELVPVMPREVGDWVRDRLDIDAVERLRHRRKVTLLEDWRTGATIFQMIFRNETLVASIT